MSELPIRPQAGSKSTAQAAGNANREANSLDSASDGPHELTTHLDPKGDLTLRVGARTEHGAHDFVVCSRAMARSSAVWNRMLFGIFSESKPATGDWIVTLPEDDPRSLAALLSITHGRFASVPQTPSIESLYSIMVLANKYDMTEMVQPWAQPWFLVAKAAIRSDAPLVGFVAWELGAQGLVKTAIQHLILDCSLNDRGRLQTSQRIVLEDCEALALTSLVRKSGLRWTRSASHHASPSLLTMRQRSSTWVDTRPSKP